MKTLRVGVIGLGVGEQHIRAYQSVPGVEVRMVCDLDATKLSSVAQKYGILETATNWRDVAEHPDIDVVSICSYDDGHAAQCQMAFLNGKHVMVEKPVALFRKEAEAVVRAQQDSGKLITSNLILRQSPRFKEVRQQVKAGEFGDIFCIEGGYIHDILWKITEGWRGKMDFYCTIFGGGIHLFDLMRWIMGQEIVEICGMGSKVLTKGSAYRYDDSFLNIFRFEGGALGKCHTTFGPARTKFHELTVFGTKKTFVNDLPNGKLFTGDREEDESVVATAYPGMEKGDLIPDFIAAIREGREPNVGARDVFRIMDLCFAALESVEKRRTVPVSYMV